MHWNSLALGPAPSPGRRFYRPESSRGSLQVLRQPLSFLPRRDVGVDSSDHRTNPEIAPPAMTAVTITRTQVATARRLVALTSPEVAVTSESAARC